MHMTGLPVTGRHGRQKRARPGPMRHMRWNASGSAPHLRSRGTGSWSGPRDQGGEPLVRGLQSDLRSWSGRSAPPPLSGVRKVRGVRSAKQEGSRIAECIAGNSHI
jgi:hypothetical protein